MKYLILLACCSLSLASTLLDAQNAWHNFKINHSKVYADHVEELTRRTIFEKNYRAMVEHNEKYERGLTTYKLGINQFSDMIKEEVNLRNGYKKSKLRDYEDLIPYVPPENYTAPDELDWRSLGAVTQVKNQGNCGSCWTFSTTGALEGAVYLKTGILPILSEQNLVDCSTDDYNNGGCDGGDMPGAIQYVIDNDGINYESYYPYEGVDGDCRYNKSGNATSARNVSIVEQGNEDLLKIALSDVGPIAIAIDASNSDFHSYSEGVYARSDCLTEADELDHAVLLVGYGTEKGVDYWLVKNSWDNTWGLDGYIKMARNKNNMCGIASEPIIPIMW